MRVHIVQKGDTLWKIAKQYGIGFDELKRLNAQLANPDYIVPGMEIFLPESMEMPMQEGMSKSKVNVVKGMQTEEIQWKPSKEIQYIEESVEKPIAQPQQNPYSYMPQTWYMPTYQQPTYQQVTYQPTYQLPTYQQVTYQPMYYQPTYPEPTYEQPAKEESPQVEPVKQEPVKTEPIYEQPVYTEPVYYQPMYYQPPCGCQQPVYHYSPCGCQQPVYHHSPCGCQQPMYQPSCGCQQPMYQQPMYQQPMYPSSTYDQPMYYPAMYQPVEGCERPAAHCEDKEEQVKGYYEDIKYMEHMNKYPSAQPYYPYPYQQWQ